MADDVEMGGLNREDSRKALLAHPSKEEKKEEEEKKLLDIMEDALKLESPDLKDMKMLFTTENLVNSTKTGYIEKCLEFSYKLKSLGESKCSNAEGFIKLARQVEDFAYHLLDPLKDSDWRRTLFQEYIFDRVSDAALKYRQKKFISHPVYHRMMKQQWTGTFYQVVCGSSDVKNWLKYALIFIWALFDLFLFPLVHTLLGLIHLMIKFVKEKKDYRVIFVCYAQSRKNPLFGEITKCIMEKLKKTCVRAKFAAIRNYQNRKVEPNFTDPSEIQSIFDDEKDSEKEDSQVKETLLLVCKKAETLFDKTEEKSRKVLVLLKNECDPVRDWESFTEMKESSFKEKNVEVISEVALARGPKSYSQEVVKCIQGKDIYDRYVQYFETPYFIFFRDIWSYLALLGLHFAVCLQPSTIHFTAVEWIISVFFLGRFMMEVSQFVKEGQDHGEGMKGERDETNKLNKAQKKEKNTSAYFSDWWNKLDVIMLLVFLNLVVLRVFIRSQHSSVSNNRLLAVAGYLYGLNAMFLTLRVFGHILEYNKFTGSIQIALFHIFNAVIIIFGQFVVTTMAFSLAITKIYIAEASYYSGGNKTSASGQCQNQKGLYCWWSFTIHLAWSLLGFTDRSLLRSSDQASDTLAWVLYFFFLVMGVVMLMNMMIALLSNTYQKVEDNSYNEWSYKRATTIRSYTKYHPFPVPFNVISQSYFLLRRIYKKIECKCCKRKDEIQETEVGVNSVEENIEENLKENVGENVKENEEENVEEKILERLSLVYFSKYGHRFPEEETDRGNRRMLQHFAQRAFLYSERETQQLLQSHGQINEWDATEIAIFGQRLEYALPTKFTAVTQMKNYISRYGARYRSPLSKEYPEFEVLIQETGEIRRIVIGIVTEKHEIHNLPGWDPNTAGYHIGKGKIYDSDDPRLGRQGNNSMAYSGDVIGCKILYDEEIDGKLPVSFTLNGRVVGKAKLTCCVEDVPERFFPCVGMGCEGISVLFRMCRRMETSFEQQTRLPSTKPSTDLDLVIQKLNTISDQQHKQQQITSDRLTELDRKIDCLSRRTEQQEEEA